MFLIPVDSVIGFSTAAPTTILTRLFQFWDYSYQQVWKSGCLSYVNGWFKDGQLNYTTARSNGRAHALLSAMWLGYIGIHQLIIWLKSV